MTSHHAIAAEIERRATRHISAMRRIWNLHSSGPRLDVEVTGPSSADLTLRGRSRTLANRVFRWQWVGGTRSTGRGIVDAPTLEEALGDPDAKKPLDMQLHEVASAQAMRAAVANALKLGPRSMDVERLLVDRTDATLLVREKGQAALLAIAMAARELDMSEIVPNDHGTVLGMAGEGSFSVAPCQLGAQGTSLRRPELGLPSRIVGLARRIRATCGQGKVHIQGAELPSLLTMSADGRRLGEIIETRERCVNDRLIERVDSHPGGITIWLQNDMVEIGSLFGRRSR